MCDSSKLVSLLKPPSALHGCVRDERAACWGGIPREQLAPGTERSGVREAGGSGQACFAAGDTSHGPDGGRVAVRRLLPRRPQHGQHEHRGAHH